MCSTSAHHGQRPRGATVRASRLVDRCRDVDSYDRRCSCSEVVTNAILHARTTVTLTVGRRRRRGPHRRSRRLTRCVHGCMPSAPTSTTGRGLRLLDRLARAGASTPIR
jgi:anti-sigma regulatory factor (Ser/Thr protein kinase)